MGAPRSAGHPGSLPLWVPPRVQEPQDSLRPGSLCSEPPEQSLPTAHMVLPWDVGGGTWGHTEPGCLCVSGSCKGASQAPEPRPLGGSGSCVLTLPPVSPGLIGQRAHHHRGRGHERCALPTGRGVSGGSWSGSDSDVPGAGRAATAIGPSRACQAGNLTVRRLLPSALPTRPPTHPRARRPVFTGETRSQLNLLNFFRSLKVMAVWLAS